jgi:hypothetical protein
MEGIYRYRYLDLLDGNALVPSKAFLHCFSSSSHQHFTLGLLEEPLSSVELKAEPSLPRMTYLLEAADVGVSINAGAVHLPQQIFMEDFFELCAVEGVNGHEVNETSLATSELCLIRTQWTASKPRSVHRHPQSLSLSTQPPRQALYQRSHPASIDRAWQS